MDHLTQEQLQELEDAFNLLTAKDENINIKKLREIMHQIGQNPTQEELIDMMNELDTDGDGTICLEEFTNLMVRKMQTIDIEEEFQEAFKFFDTKNENKINFTQFQKALARFGDIYPEDQLQEVFNSVDIDLDGSINYEEFMKLINY